MGYLLGVLGPLYLSNYRQHFLFLLMHFFYGGVCARGRQNTNHLIIKKCHFSAFQISKKKSEMGRGKTSTSWQFFLTGFLFFLKSKWRCLHFFFKEKVYTYYIYILTYLRLFYFLVFLVLCLLCSSPQVFFACLYRAALLLHACVFTEGSSNSLDPSTVRRELCHGNVHIGDGGTIAILQQGVFF